MTSSSQDARIRMTALRWCDELRQRWGDHVPASELSPFPFEGSSIHLRGQQGIFKPRQLQDGPLSIRSALDSPYNDEVLGGGSVIRYDFAPRTREAENDGLKRLAGTGAPLIYLVQVADKRMGVEYLVVSPVFVSDWDDAQRVFSIVLAAPRDLPESTAERLPAATEPELARAYRMQTVQTRLHQARFRKLVLRAYRDRCSICELRVRPLLDAAHILPDSKGGRPVVTNGLGLCSLHHRAMDRGILRVLPDYTIAVDAADVRPDDSVAVSLLLDQHGRSISLPRDERQHPDKEMLAAALAG